MTMKYRKCDSCHASVLPQEEQSFESYTLCPECYEMVKQGVDEKRDVQLWSYAIVIILVSALALYMLR